MILIPKIKGAIIERIDLILAILGIIIGIIILSLSFMEKISQHYIGFTILISSALYLVIRGRLNERTIRSFTLSIRQKKGLDIIFYCLFTLTVIIWYYQLYLRPVIYFISVAFLCGLISIFILSVEEKRQAWGVLFKIFLLAFSVRAGIYYNFPSIMGYDAFIHLNIANVISATGSIPPFEISEKYINYPILHIFISVTKIISSISIKNAAFFSVGIANILISIFVFIIVYRLTNYKVGLLSALIISFSNDLILTGIVNITAGSLVLCYFLILLFLLQYKGSTTPRMISLIILFTGMTIVTHQLSTFVVYIVMCIFIIITILYNWITEKKSATNINGYLYIVLFSISIFFYWMNTTSGNAGTSFFETVLLPLMDVLTTGGGYGNDLLIVGHDYARPFLDTLLLQICYLIIPFLAIGGIFWWLSRKDYVKFLMASTAGILFVLIYAIPLLGIRNLLTDRWTPFLNIFLGVLAAAYIIGIVNLFNTNLKRIALLFSIIMVFSLFMVVAPNVNKDHPLFAEETTVRNQFTDNEIVSAERLSENSNDNIIVDAQFLSVFQFYGTDLVVNDQLNFYQRLHSFDDEKTLIDSSKKPGVVVVLRKSTLHEPLPFRASELYADSVIRTLSQSVFDEFEKRDYNMIYTNGNVIGYRFYGDA